MIIDKKSNLGNKANSFRDYINLFKNNIVLISIITTLFLIATTIYAVIAPNVYTSTVSLKLTAPKGSILSGKIGDFQDLGGLSNDRYIATEIQTIYNSSIRYEVARAIIDTFKANKNKDDFSLIFDKGYFQSTNNSLKSTNEIAANLFDNVRIAQMNNLDFIDIAAESRSPFEAALIANIFATKYREYNLYENRKQITVIKEFLGELLKEKRQQLYGVEDAIKEYQLKKGGVQLDRQAQLLISTLADFESKRIMLKSRCQFQRKN